MMVEEAKSIPAEIIGRAESKLIGFRTVKGEIDDAMEIVHEKLEEIK